MKDRLPGLEPLRNKIFFIDVEGKQASAVITIRDHRLIYFGRETRESPTNILTHASHTPPRRGYRRKYFDNASHQLICLFTELELAPEGSSCEHPKKKKSARRIYS